LLDELCHPNTKKYPNQSVLVVAIDDYVYLVPYVDESDQYFVEDGDSKQKSYPRLFSEEQP